MQSGNPARLKVKILLFTLCCLNEEVRLSCLWFSEQSDWIPQTQAVISVLLAGQLPCFLLTESNMQHPQKKAMGFCLPFLVRHFFFLWPKKNHDWDWFYFKVETAVQQHLLFHFTSLLLLSVSRKSLNLQMFSNKSMWTDQTWTSQTQGPTTPPLSHRKLNIASIDPPPPAGKPTDSTFQISWGQNRKTCSSSNKAELFSCPRGRSMLGCLHDVLWSLDALLKGRNVQKQGW